MDHHPSGLVDYEHVFVFENDVQGDILRLQVPALRRRKPYLDDVTGLDLSEGLVTCVPFTLTIPV